MEFTKMYCTTTSSSVYNYEIKEKRKKCDFYQKATEVSYRVNSYQAQDKINTKRSSKGSINPRYWSGSGLCNSLSTLQY